MQLVTCRVSIRQSSDYLLARPGCGCELVAIPRERKYLESESATEQELAAKEWSSLDCTVQMIPALGTTCGQGLKNENCARFLFVRRVKRGLLQPNPGVAGVPTYPRGGSSRIGASALSSGHTGDSRGRPCRTK